MLWRCEGFQKSGKTLLAVGLAKCFYDVGYPVYTNMKSLTFGQKMELDDLLGFRGNMNNGVILLDEMHTLFDSRNAMSQGNKLASYFATQVGKRHCVLIYTTHLGGMIEGRIFRLTTLRFRCRTPDQGQHIFVNALNEERAAEAAYFSGIAVQESWYVVDGRKVWGLYDPDEPILPSEIGHSEFASKSQRGLADILDNMDEVPDRAERKAGRKRKEEKFMEEVTARVGDQMRTLLRESASPPADEAVTTPLRRRRRSGVAALLGEE